MLLIHAAHNPNFIATNVPLNMSSLTYFTVFYGTTICTNVIGVSLLAYRLWMYAQSEAVYGRGLKLIAVALLDTGALYTLSLLAALICFLLDTTAHGIIQDLVRRLCRS